MAKLGGLSISLQGADSLSKAFDELRASMKRRITKRAITKAARVVVPPLRRATPKAKGVQPKGTLGKKQAALNPPGTMRKSTGLVFRKYRGGAIQSAYIGHRWPKGAAAHLIEFGTKERTDKRGRNRGKVTAAPFFRPVWDATKSQAHHVLQAELQAGVLAEVRKAAAKHG